MLGTGSALAFAAGLYRYRAVHNALQVLLRQSGTALEELPAPRGLLDEDWQALVRAVDAARRSTVERSETVRRDAQEYCHPVGTPDQNAAGGYAASGAGGRVPLAAHVPQ